MDTKIEFSKKIKFLRAISGLSQNAFAEICGTTQSAVSKWERCELEPTLDMLRKISLKFTISIDELLGNELAIDDTSFESKKLLYSFNKLNQEGLEKLLEQAELLISSNKYIKNSEYELVEKKEEEVN